jgi:hypothetical protein
MVPIGDATALVVALLVLAAVSFALWLDGWHAGYAVATAEAVTNLGTPVRSGTCAVGSRLVSCLRLSDGSLVLVRWNR